MPAIKPLEIGEYILRFELPATDGQAVSPDLLVGKSLLLHFYGKTEDPQTVARLCELRDLHAQFADLGIVVLGLGVEPIEPQKRCAQEHSLPFQLLSDSNAQTFLEYGALQEITIDGQTAHMPVATTYLIGPNFRVERIWQNLPANGHAAEVLETARKLLEPEAPRPLHIHAPVLLLPNVLPPRICKSLIELWETDNGDSGFMRQVEGKTVGIYDYSHKIRRDHFIQPGPLMTELQEYIKHRVIAPISQAFNYAATRREDYRWGMLRLSARRILSSASGQHDGRHRAPPFRDVAAAQRRLRRRLPEIPRVWPTQVPPHRRRCGDFLLLASA